MNTTEGKTMNDLATGDGLGGDLLPATPANIRRLWPVHGDKLFGVDASEGSFEEFSVNPGDYADFADCDDDERLFGDNAVLCLRRPPFEPVMIEPEEGNARRAMFGGRAVDAGSVDRGKSDDRTDAIDTVANVLHWLQGIGEDDPAAILNSAASHFFAETEGEASA